jgi:hypothetical protein
MSHFAQKAPTSPTRAHELHDQSKLPATPHKTRADRVRLASLVITAIVLAVTFTAIGIHIRAGWESHRDWVVPVIAQGAAIGAVAAAYLIVRGRDGEFAIGSLFLILCIVVMGANQLRAEETEGPDTLRDVYSIISGVLFAIAMHAYVIGWLYAEIWHPSKPKAADA